MRLPFDERRIAHDTRCISSSARPWSTAGSSSHRSSPPRPGCALHHARRGAAARAPDHGDVGLGLVPELFVENPIDSSVLLYDGEELVGAKQNRILNVSVLVGAGAKLPIPVSCVEQGRWSRLSDKFGAAPHISHSHLRRRKAETLAAQPLARASRRATSGTRCARSRRGWASARRPRRTATRSRRTPPGSGAREGVRARPGQCGAVLALGDDLCLDAVSRPDAFALLWPKLRAGYLLDALERLDGRATSVERIAAFVDDVGAAQATRGPSAGLGEDVRLRGPRCCRLRARARRRDDPAVGVHERGRRRAGVRPDRTAESAALRFRLGSGCPASGRAPARGAESGCLAEPGTVRVRQPPPSPAQIATSRRCLPAV